MEAARAALLSDGEQVSVLRVAANDALKGARGALLLKAERLQDFVPWSAWVEEADRLAVVGTLETHVVGYALARLRAIDDGHLLGVIEEVWVEVGARGVGVGEALMASITDWCVQQGCSGMDGVALPGDRVMKGFFERYGLTARLLVMHRSLPGAQG